MFLGGGLFSVIPNIQAQHKNPRPNIVFIMADDLGWSDLGVTGSDFHETPNIDRLASEGLRFDNAYAAAANSAPSRACLMTGMYTPYHGVFTVSPSERGDRTKRKLIPSRNTEDVRAEWVKKIPLRRGGTVDDIANTAVYLASDLSSYVTGQVIQVDGGMNT